MARKCKISFTVMDYTVPSFVSMLSKEAIAFTVSYVEDALQIFSAPDKKNDSNATKEVVREVPVIKVKPARKIRNGDPRLSGPGKEVMKLFQNGQTIIHFIDAEDAIMEAGYLRGNAGSTLGKLVKQGHIMKIHRGAYRLPTTTEALAFIEKRKAHLGVR